MQHNMYQYDHDCPAGTQCRLQWSVPYQDAYSIQDENLPSSGPGGNGNASNLSFWDSSYASYCYNQGLWHLWQYRISMMYAHWYYSQIQMSNGAYFSERTGPATWSPNRSDYKDNKPRPMFTTNDNALRKNSNHRHRISRKQKMSRKTDGCKTGFDGQKSSKSDPLEVNVDYESEYSIELDDDFKKFLEISEQHRRERGLFLQ